MFDSSEAAEDAFYAAFARGRLDEMMKVWSTAEDVVCIHPGGPRLRGVAEIRASWAQIFDNSMPRAFELRGRLILGEGAQRIHLVEENIRVPGTHFVSPPVLATNVYRREGRTWRLVLHHASVAPASLASTRSAADDSPAPPRLH